MAISAHFYIAILITPLKAVAALQHMTVVYVFDLQTGLECVPFLVYVRLLYNDRLRYPFSLIALPGGKWFCRFKLIGPLTLPLYVP